MVANRKSIINLPHSYEALSPVVVRAALFAALRLH
jgi:hypothetical protein